MPKITIRHRGSDEALFEHEVTDEQQACGIAMRVTLEAATKAATKARANLAGADLAYADLAGVNLAGANLAGADLAGADLAGADLVGANLAGADMAGADMAGANLAGANLAGADLAYADLAYADLAGADLAGANLAGANLAGADLGGSLKLVGLRPCLHIGPIGSRAATLTLWLTDQGPRVQTGCFFGTRAAFEAAVADEHGDGCHGREYGAALALLDAHIEHWAPPATQTAVGAA
ncbi:pentapeptide repeat-containing protein [Aquariibacter albus]|uniref:Pentapeptide repeat-containing protein n=1 Tax=Aquariibacter albus TaxID=2759899 RepID=A0A839HI33_9BURK|nr:pentapeptide repeat-containing protein [Aquariibacter albus]MBB1161493.1 pentapeptide repeat-containing protein [Aquariibacter albus]